MRTIRFDGSSDDLIAVNGQANYPECDEIGNYTDTIHKGSFTLDSKLGGSMIVHAIYDGCWTFAPGLYEEEATFPDWPIRYKHDPVKARGYSLILEIDAPDDATVKWNGKDDDGDL